MPGKYKSQKADEYESDDLETEDTLIGRNRVITTPVKKKSRPASAGKKKVTKRPVTPAKKKRAQSAPPTRSGHELWMNAVKNRLTVGLASNRRPESPRHKSAGEFWIDTLRKTGQGFTTESTGMNTFSGKRPRDKDMPYLSTPSYLRQMVGTEKPGRHADPMAKPAAGRPAYKSQEEYYEQILEYKKQVTAMNQDASAMKSKIRRLEEDNLKNQKEIDSLLNPHKSEELRRTLADKKPDSGSVIHSLKQKILKLETQLRDKEASFIKLQSDLKTTKIEELNKQMEVFYNEIVRLQNSKDTGMAKSTMGRDGTVKVKALNETILRLNKSNEQLQAENRSLKEDLKMSIDDNKSAPSKLNTPSSPGRKVYNIPTGKREYEDMNRKELLRTIAQLERKIERHGDSGSIVSYESRAAAVPGKIALDGTLEDRLDQLDKRESDLLEMLEKNKTKIKQLTEEKNRWKRRCEDLENTFSGGHSESAYDARARRGQSPRGSRPPTGGSRPMSARRDGSRPESARSEARVERPLSGRVEKGSRPPSARRRSSIDSGVSSSRKHKIQAFKENRSAKTIQRKWRSHQNDVNQGRQHQAGKSGTHSPTHVTQDTKTLEWVHKTSSIKQDPLSTPRIESPKSHETSHKMHTATTGQKATHKSGDKEKVENERKIEHFRQNHAAKTIQRRWTGHQYQKHEQEREEASDLIRSALMGHSSRRKQINAYHSPDEDDDYETEDEEYNECVGLIQSAMLGHTARRSRINNTRLSSAGEEDYDDEDDDDDILGSPKRRLSTSKRSNRPQSPAQYRSRPQSGRSRTSSKVSAPSYGRRSSVLDDDDDF